MTTEGKILEDLISGLAIRYPKGGWTNGPHPELGDMPEETAPSILALIDRQAEALKGSEEEIARLRHVISTSMQAAQGTLEAAHGTEFKEGHEDWSPLAELIVELRLGAAKAIFASNQRVFRSKEFMDPQEFAELHYGLYSDYYAERGYRSGKPWTQLSPEQREEMIQISRQISLRHAARVDGMGKGVENDPTVQALLKEGQSLGRAMGLIAYLKQSVSYRDLARLDEFLRETFPKQAIQGDDPAMDAVRRAIEILTLVHRAAPDTIRLMWENIVRPAIHIMSAYGIEILPPGTIVYGAKPNTNVHRPE